MITTEWDANQTRGLSTRASIDLTLRARKRAIYATATQFNRRHWLCCWSSAHRVPLKFSSKSHYLLPLHPEWCHESGRKK